MPELPEIASRVRGMSAELQGKIISGIKVTQPKCLNVPLVEFRAGLQGSSLGKTTCR